MLDLTLGPHPSFLTKNKFLILTAKIKLLSILYHRSAFYDMTELRTKENSFCFRNLPGKHVQYTSES